MKAKITMQDIATSVGVSKVTVSKALNNKEDISDKLKKKIIKKAKELGYRYNSAGKALRNNQSYNIGILSSERFFGEESSYYAKILSLITGEAEKFGYTSLFQSVSLEDERNQVLPRMYLEQKVDGIIILGQLKRDYIDKITNIEIPVIFLDFYHIQYENDSINVDNVYVVNKLTNYLVSLGHQKIAFVGNLRETSSIQDRFLGYLKTLNEHGIHYKEDYVINDRDETGALIPFVLPQDMPTAFICNNDKVAYFLINQLKDLGYRVPQDISVVGFDNTIHSQISNPKITTVDIDIEEMVFTAVQFITKKISDKSKKYGRVFIDANIIYRESVDKIREDII